MLDFVFPLAPNCLSARRCREQDHRNGDLLEPAIANA